MPVVSVIMPFFNVEPHLERSIASLRSQTFTDWELIAIDDASTDGSARRLLEIAEGDVRVKLHRMTRNGGPSVARNAGLLNASGEWVTLLDADDAYETRRLELLLSMSGGLDMIFDNLSLWDAGAGVTSGTALPEGVQALPFRLHNLIESEAPGSKYKLGFLKPMIRRDFLFESNLHYDEKLRFAEDFNLYARCLLGGAKALITHLPLYVYTTQIGKVSNVRSSGSHTTFDPHVRTELARRLIDDFSSSASEEDVNLLKQYFKWQVRYAVAYDLAEMRKNWDLFNFARTAVSNPSALWSFLSTSRIFKKVAGAIT